MLGSVLIARLPIGMFRKKIGVYQIKNLLDGKLYIGSSKNIIRRWKEHFRDIKLRRHKNKYLQRSVLKYGYDNFECSILKETSEEKRIVEEQKIINGLSNEQKIYNIALNVLELSINNFKWKSDLQRIKVARERMLGPKNSMFGYRYTQEERVWAHDRSAGINNGNFRRKHTKEERQKISLARKRNSRKYKSQEFREKLKLVTKGSLNGNYGKKWTSQKRKQLSEERKGIWFIGDKNGNRKLFDKYKKIVIHLYWKKHKTMKQISNIFNVSQNTMTCFFKRHKIAKKNKKGEKNGNRTN